MIATTELHRGSLAVIDYRCDAGPGEKSYPEYHDRHSVSYVKRGCFGWRAYGKTFDLVAGSIVVGHPGDEFMCTHEHSHGDECLSFRFTPELAHTFGDRAALWRIGCLPPLPELMVLGELARCAAAGDSNMGLDEIGMLITGRFISAVNGSRPQPPRVQARDRKRAIEAALRIDARSDDPLDLETLAHEARLSPYHFLRVFAKVIGVTPHQYLLRVRLRRAARLLVEENTRAITDIAYEVGFCDMSNFVRTFRRAATVSPGQFRLASKGDRKILQARLTDAR